MSAEMPGRQPTDRKVSGAEGVGPCGEARAEEESFNYFQRWIRH